MEYKNVLELRDYFRKFIGKPLISDNPYSTKDHVQSCDLPIIVIKEKFDIRMHANSIDVARGLYEIFPEWSYYKYTDFTDLSKLRLGTIISYIAPDHPYGYNGIVYKPFNGMYYTVLMVIGNSVMPIKISLLDDYYEIHDFITPNYFD